MKMILGLSYIAVLPVIATMILYLLDKKTSFAKLNNRTKQLIYGLVFGGLAIIGSEFGVDVGGAAANTRDAAVLTAGLVFGSPAGIIAGIIGAFERYISVYWGGGTYTRLACSLSTLIAGFFGAILRKYMFNDKKPSVAYALAIGLVTEVMHMLMIFITNMSDIATAFVFVQKCSVPMITVNGIAVMLAVLVVSLLAKERIRQNKRNRQIAVVAQRWLLLCVIAAFLTTSFFTASLQIQIANADTKELLKLNIRDLMADIEDTSSKTAKYQEDITGDLIEATLNRHIGKSGYLMIADSNGNVLSGAHSGKNVYDTDMAKKLSGTQYSDTLFETEFSGEESYFMYKYKAGYYFIGVLPKAEADFSRDISIYMIVFMEIVIFVGLFILIYFLIKKLVVDNINSVNESLAEITRGNLNVTVNVRSNEEFASLSDDINATVDTLKQFIAEAAARIDRELEHAKVIQESSLPSVFPPFPNKKELDIFATMDAAKEVGGDFYDFYLLDENHLAFLVADVSGKGITGAMFMMKAKTLIKSFAEHSKDAAEILTKTNEALCEGNEAEMFVTCFFGILDLENEKIEFANAGHNPPLIRKKGQTFEYFKSRPGFVLGGMEGIKYRKGEIEFNRGDRIFLYTDGVTEATSDQNELYGEERLRQILNLSSTMPAKDICLSTKASVDKFVGDAAQFDDITTLCIGFACDQNEEQKMKTKEITLAATVENIEVVTDFVNEQLDSLDCPPKPKMQIAIAIDELFGNIAQYAYHPEVGDATVRVEIEDDPLAVIISFTDGGKPYDPLKRDDPDTALSAEDREVGGLGIFLVKKSMDDISYEYKEGKNILKIRKNI